MSTAWARLWRFLGVRGVFLLVFLTGGTAALLVLNSDTTDLVELLTRQPIVTVAYVMTVGAIVTAAVAYSRPARSRSQNEVLPGLKRDGFCTLLRSFGDDGRLLVPHEQEKQGAMTILASFTDPNLTFEQVLGGLSAGHELACVGIVDQRSALVPPGVTFMRARDEEWQDVAHRLVTDARAIVLLFASRGTIRAGFRWEIETIAATGMAHRAILVLPPPDHDLELYARAREDVCQALSLLDCGRHAPEHFARLMPATAIVVQLVPDAPYPRWWRSEWEQPRRCGRSGAGRVGNVTYALALHEALVGIDDGEARYDDLSSIRTKQSRSIRVSGPDAARDGEFTVLRQGLDLYQAMARALLGPALSTRRRAGRTEFWTMLVLGPFLGLIGGGATFGFTGESAVLPLVFLGLAMVPVACAAVRRLHDLDRPGWWLILGAVPVLGLPVQILLTCRRGSPGLNRYGAARESPDWEAANTVGVSYVVELVLLVPVLVLVHAATGL
ncbi:hypothetical protein GCM10023200_19760 [Actinomycetospora chlora]|uniref:DUF805 domain-containing protein n=1 Tax=Actinomycetospora chlora TaxID=663608 RepID=A0ABP9AUG0_9PSEU